MCCTGVNRFGPCTYFQGKDDIGYEVSYIALAIIIACGFPLAVCSIISYLPPNVGYCGGALCISSLIIFAVLIVGKKCSRPEEHHFTKASDVGQKPVVSKIPPENQTGNVPVGTAEIIPSPPQVAPCLLNDMYIRIFEYLGARCVSKLSQVCVRWAEIVLVDALWQKFCVQELFCTFGGEPSSPHYYKEAYQNSKIFKRNVLQWRSPEHKMPIPKPVELAGHLGANKFLVTKDKCFIYHSGVPEDQFEIWDATLKNRLLRGTIPSVSKVCLKLIGKIVYFIGWERIPGNLSRNIYVCPFNIETNSFMPTLEFAQEHRTHLEPRTQFAINDKKAFTSQEDGGIRVWDLELEGKPNTEGSILVWNSQYEWKYSVKFTRYQETSDVNQPYERKVLIGHTKEITALQIFGNYLFSSAHDGTIKQWDLSTYECIQTIETGLGEGITFFQAAGRYVFGSTDNRRRVYQWDLATKNLLFTADLEYDCSAFLPVYNFLFCAYGGTRINIYDLSTGACVKITNTDLRSSHFEVSDNFMQMLDDRLYILRCVLLKDRLESQLIAWDLSLSNDTFITSEQNPQEASKTSIFDMCSIS